MLNDQPRQQLQFLISQYSTDICDDVRRCEALLRDLCPEHKRELNLLIAALKERIPQDLLKNSPSINTDLTVKLLAQRLHDHLGIAEAFALWAVESWALALIVPPKPKNTWQEPHTGMEFVRIKAGSFIMGSAVMEHGRNLDERPHSVTIAKDFFLAKYPVTQAQWQTVMGSNPSYFQGGQLPVERISWLDVQQFIEKLTRLSPERFRLPSEAEWEYACRAGTHSAFYTGEELETQQANFANHIGQTSPVGLYPANAWQLHDMIGNVWEWTGSEYDEQYTGAENIIVTKTVNSSWRVVRGGSWHLEARHLRSANRHNYTSDFRYSSIGFRLVKDID